MTQASYVVRGEVKSCLTLILYYNLGIKQLDWDIWEEFTEFLDISSIILMLLGMQELGVLEPAREVNG